MPAQSIGPDHQRDETQTRVRALLGITGALDERSDDPEIADLPFFARSRTTASGSIWSVQSDDLSATLIALEPGQRVVEPRDDEADVLLVGIAGEGIVETSGSVNFVWAGATLLIPKGARRTTEATNGRFTFLACRRALRAG